MPLIFIDCEARGPSPFSGRLYEFGAVPLDKYPDAGWNFHGIVIPSVPDPENPAIPKHRPDISNYVYHLSNSRVFSEFYNWTRDVTSGKRAVMVSDNPAYDFMWTAYGFDKAGLDNPYGHSARRISDFWAGLNRDFYDTQKWKSFRVTPHDHNPVHDAIGNVEAFLTIQKMIKEGGFPHA